MKFPEGDVAPDPAKFLAAWATAPGGTRLNLAPRGRGEKAGLLEFTPTEPGCHLLAVRTRPRVLELSADDFNSYLVADGLPHVFLQRAKDGTLRQPGRERYSKSPKLLLRVGQPLADPAQPGGDPCRRLDLPLEITPLENPFAKMPGTALAVEVRFQGKPLAEANLGWDYPGPEPAPRGTVRTNAEGQALVPLARSGWMSIRLTHMTQPKTAEYEWESFWTSLTFEVPAGDPGRKSY